MEYAAVIIPTLNRKKHLKRCVDSLLRNKECDKTDLYISVDFPPSEKYKEGYEEVKQYVKTIDGFGSVNIYFQEENLGPGLNRRFLESKMSEKHDKYVFTDDDNEFSSNFLSYVNWGLEYFKDDESVYAICSCTDFDIDCDNKDSDYFMIQSYNPYGTGHWIHKNKKCADYLKQSSIEEIYNSKEKSQLLFDHFPLIYMWVAQDSLRRIYEMRGANDSLTYIDIWENVYIIQNGLNCVKPVIPKSRNWGQDGTGVHVSSNEKEDFVPKTCLDTEEWKSEPVRMEACEEEKNFQIFKNKKQISKKEKTISDILFYLNRSFGNKSVYSFYNAMKKTYKKVFRKKSNNTGEVKYG